ncbi:MAG: dTDP-4-dehydrorhamnose reductase [Gemmatimonadaceae bacterium]
MKRILVTGANGMTGSEVCAQAAAAGWTVRALSHADADITDAGALRAAANIFHPHVVVNCAAYTAVDRAESEPELAMAVNGVGAANVARAAAAVGAPIVHVSTDYVFNGRGTTPYSPEDRTDPINSYGKSKLAGEIGVRAENSKSVIVRTSWVFSHRGPNFVRTMLRLGSERDELKIVEDQTGRPTSATDLASALFTVAHAIPEKPTLAGTYHFANSGETSWFGFAQAIFEEARMLGETRIPKISAIKTSEYPTAASRPAYSVLDTSGFTAAFGVNPRSWRSALRDTIALSLRNAPART